MHFDGVEIEPPTRQAERSSGRARLDALAALQCENDVAESEVRGRDAQAGRQEVRRFLGLRRPFLERHLQARHRQPFETEVAGDQAARFGIHGQAAHDDVRSFVVDDDTVRRQGPRDRATRASHLDFQGGQLAQPRDGELESRLREQQPVQEDGDAAGQRQQQSDEHE